MNELHGNIQDVFNEYGVQIMSPNYGPILRRRRSCRREKWFEPPAVR